MGDAGEANGEYAVPKPQANSFVGIVVVNRGGLICDTAIKSGQREDAI